LLNSTKQLQEHNKIVKVAFLVVRCCLWCFEKCLKFLSKNAYIVIAMKGSSFCAASVESFRILLKNLARVAVVNSISFFLLLLVRTTITLAVGVFVFAVLSSSANAVTTTANELAILSGPVTSPMAPVLVACVLAWLVASAFANVYDTAIDTILLCFCEDTDMNGESASEYMSNELKRIMGARTTSHKVIRVGSKAVNESSSSPQAQQQAGTSNKVHIETEI
jgi:choline transporter-like protein 2/4/5